LVFLASLLATPIVAGLDDGRLQRELPGYAEFAVCARYKWIPGSHRLDLGWPLQGLDLLRYAQSRQSACSVLSIKLRVKEKASPTVAIGV
jgi:hypothetical protein